MQADDDADMETVDGAFGFVPRALTVTRPASPSPSFRTDSYSIVNWTDNNDIFGDPRPSLSDAAPSSSTPYNTIRFASPSPVKASKSLGLLPKIWDALRDSSPTKRGKRRFENISSSFWSELDIDGIVDYASLPPLDGEEGELIDDEACFIDVRAVTGLDIITLLPEEVAIHTLSYLDLKSVIACLSVSKTWRRLAHDNALWRRLFRNRKVDGWALDLRKYNVQTPASLLAMSHSGLGSRHLPAQLQLDWRDLYMTRAELDQRWAGTSVVGTSEDKENATVFEPRMRKLSGHTDSVYCLEFDSSKIITGSRDKTIKVWSLKTGKCLATFSGHNGSVLCLKFDKDWDLDPANALSEEESAESYSATGHSLWRKGFMVSGSSDSSVCVWDMYSCPVERSDGTVDMAVTAVVRGILRGHTLGVLDIRIDGKWIVSCSKDCLIRVWNRVTLELHCTLSGHEGPVNAVGLQGNRVASASGDGKMMLWDLATGKRLRIFEGHDRGLACIEFKGDTIVSGSNDYKIKVWDANTGECVRTLAGHDNLVRALSFDTRNGRLVSGSYDRTVKIWDLTTGKLLREFKGCHTSHIFDVNFDASRITVLTGLAPNGGLYIPQNIPQLPSDWQSKWKDHSFVDLSVEVLSLYISSEEISRGELRALVEKSYKTFRNPDVTPLKKLDDKTYILELFHGPTFAFKDVALQLLGNLFEFFLVRRNARQLVDGKMERLTVVGATSGDTGSAAIYGLRNKANISIFILHPKGRVSPIQEAQMTTVTDSNVHNLAVKGTFDDCQDIVKELFGDHEFNKTHRLGAVNSINWARILAQTVYFFLSYFHLCSQLPPSSDDVEIQYVVPTGNFGDVLAGYYAKRMGLPISKLVVATNSNDILARFWQSGAYEKVDSNESVSSGDATEPAEGASDGKQAQAAGGVKETLSPAMDILVSSNFERLLWYLTYETTEVDANAHDESRRLKAGETVDGWMKLVKSDGRVQVPTSVLELARKDFVAEKVTDQQTLDTIRSQFNATESYIADPHTAVGLAVARRVAQHKYVSLSASTIQVVLSTAHPAKFSEAVTRALSNAPSFDFERDVLPEEFKGLLERKRNVVDVEAPDVELVKKVIEKYAERSEPAQESGVSGGSV
ncbi:hypothetical protein EUX98_g3691 [Antrodiella citrinella]|uniref:threonine synthase n=1 Tax=Antrodiella citrinella TaxID=2447956 RepID=A0A4S4N406_9APHY|nr:hypothetical protein EUX98_g3691 [Antrodiella citrinella]